MSKVFLVVISAPINREAAISMLQERKLISDWFYNLPNTFFVRSTNSASEISNAISSRYGKTRHFVVSLADDRQGLLPINHWERINKKS